MKAADVASVYIQTCTMEKVCAIAGPEFGRWNDKLLIIVRALYGLRSYSSM